MCLAVFIAADHPLPLLPWHDTKPDFHVIALSDREKPVKKLLSSPHVRYAGSYEGCGCAFNVGREYPDYEYEKDELKSAEDSRRKLYEYILLNGIREMYSCNDGDNEKPIESKSEISAEDILDKTFVFKEGELITIRKTPNQAL